MSNSYESQDNRVFKPTMTKSEFEAHVKASKADEARRYALISTCVKRGLFIMGVLAVGAGLKEYFFTSEGVEQAEPISANDKGSLPQNTNPVAEDLDNSGGGSDRENAGVDNKIGQ